MTEFVEGKPCPKGHTLRYANGRQRCVACKLEDSKKRYEANPERRAETDKIWRIKNKERKRATSQAYQERNREWFRRVNKAWYYAHKEYAARKAKLRRIKNAKAYSITRRRWHLANLDKVRAKRKARIARERGAEGTLKFSDIQAMLDKQDYCCLGCDRQFSDSLPYTVDHVIPISRGGSNWPSNLQLLCLACNDSKSTKTMEEWRKVA